MADDKNKRSLENLKNSVWPDVGTDKGRRNATLGGAIVAGWIVVSYAFVLGSVFVTGETPFGPSEDPDEALGLVMITALFGLVMIVLFSFFGWRIWKRQGHVSAIITLVWTVVEVVMKLVLVTGQGVVLSIIMTLVAINGVRGTLAHRKGLKAHEVEPEETA